MLLGGNISTSRRTSIILLINLALIATANAMEKCGQVSTKSTEPEAATPITKPWSARIVILRVAQKGRATNMENSAPVKSVCGGALITPRLVLTAGHCFCSTNGGNAIVKENNFNNSLDGVIDCSNRTLGKVKELVGSATRNIRVFFSGGIATEASLGHSVSKVVVHRNILLSRPWADDIALVRLDLPSRTGRICLPGPDTNDVMLPVWLSPWPYSSSSFSPSSSSATSSSDRCVTSPFGPAKFKKCYSKSKSGGKQEELCQSEKPPPAHPTCKKFMEAVQKDEDSLTFDIAQIGANVSCYRKDKFVQGGWCYTKPPKVARIYGWGFCLPICTNNKTVPGKEVKLNVLNPSICGEELDAKRELCIGKEWRRPVVALFTPGTFNMTNITSGKAKFKSVGFHDSCEGDSGDPYYVYENGRAVVIGIKSRGGGCGRRDPPAKATRVRMFLDWIRREEGRDMYLSQNNLSNCSDRDVLSSAGKATRRPHFANSHESGHFVQENNPRFGVTDPTLLGGAAGEEEAPSVDHKEIIMAQVMKMREQRKKFERLSVAFHPAGFSRGRLTPSVSPRKIFEPDLQSSPSDIGQIRKQKSWHMGSGRPTLAGSKRIINGPLKWYRLRDRRAKEKRRKIILLNAKPVLIELKQPQGGERRNYPGWL